MRSRTISLFMLLTGLILFLLSGCETLGYYGQAASGQLYILTHRQSIDRLLASDAIDDDLRSRLAQVEAIRTFARERLQLPLGRDYSTYVDLQRPYVVWNVFATPEFSMEPQSWCYPVAGCVSYRGYFRENDARDFAARTAAEGHDVYVGGVSAYSTLGWFTDSLLNTVINREPHQLAALIFHELAHQVVYIPGDTEFNEGFATAVERAGMQRWLDSAVTDAEERRLILARAELQERRQQDFVLLIQEAVSDLEALYATTQETAAMRENKALRLALLREQYRSLKEAEWAGYDGYDDWFDDELNNAKLSTVSTYNRYVPGFLRMLEEAGGDFAQFYAAVTALSREPESDRQQALE